MKRIYIKIKLISLTNDDDDEFLRSLIDFND